MTSKEDRQRAIVAALYEASSKADFATAEQYLTDDLVITEADSLPMAGRYEGRDALRRLHGKVFGMLDVSGVEMHATCIGDDHAVVILDLILAQTGKRAQIAEMFRFRGDKICEIRPYYFDPAPCVEAAAKKAGAAKS